MSAAAPTGRSQGRWPAAVQRALLRPRGVAILIAGVVVLAFPLVEGNDSYTMSIATEALVYGLAIVTLNLLVGFGGQISLGHAGFLAIGGYTAGVLATHVSGFPVPIEILAAGAMTALVGFVLGLPTGRLRGHYLAIVTLGFGLAVPEVALNWTSLTQGRTGLVVPPPRIGNTEFASAGDLYYFTLVVLVLALLAIFSILASSTGRAFTAVRDSEAGAAAMGINVNRTKVVLFTTSAFFAGVAGDLDAHLQGIVSPDSFPLSLSLFFLAAVVVGGLASVPGSLAAAVLLAVVEAKTSSTSGWEPTIIGATVVAVLLITPGGMADLPRRLAAPVAVWRRGRRGRSPAPAEEKE
ncbi:MAG: branched-chain amino acid ABC transporter permease [Solirubrobacteraceae bacterium]